MRSSVLLPEPFGPTTAVTVPRGMVSSPTDSTVLRPYPCTRSRASSIASSLEQLEENVHRQCEGQEDETDGHGEREIAL